MIPVRVLLWNFLCYGEEEDGRPIEFDFEGSRLWSISGDNGAGKSAIFDAISYALFGQHRGGAQDDSRLIRWGAAECEAAFEFRLDEQLYRVRRTVGRRRGKGTQDPKTWQAAWFDPAAGDWRPVPETERERGLQRWVNDKLGFGYETFVASVLLLQGQSDQLIVARPKNRFEILSGLLDLQQYERLEAAANDRMRAARAQANILETQLDSLTTASAEEIEISRAEMLAGEESLREAQEKMAQLELLASEARRYTQLKAELAEATNALARDEALLKDAERIRHEYQEWRPLADALPKMRAALANLQERDAHSVWAAEAGAKAAAIDLETLERVRQRLESKEQGLERQASELRHQHNELARSLPSLRVALQRRQELSEREQSTADQGSPDEWTALIVEREASLGQRRDEKGRAEGQLRLAVEAIAQAEAALAEAQRQYAARREARDEAVCSRCGQPVDPAHIRRELEEAEQAVASAGEPVERFRPERLLADGEATSAAERVDAAVREVAAARQGLATARRADQERNQARMNLAGALEAVAAPADLLNAIADESLEEAAAAVAKQGQRIDELQTQARQAEEEERAIRQGYRDAEQAYQDARRKRDRAEADRQRQEEKALALGNQALLRLDGLDPEWCRRTLAQDKPFLQELALRCSALEGIEEQHRALEHALAERSLLESRIEERRRNIESVMREHRVPVEQAEERRSLVQRQLAESLHQRDQARETLRRLLEVRERRAQIEAELGEAHRRRTRYRRLADLLGRGGLQGYLMNAAIQGISRLANETLARISGGQLQIQILRQASARGEGEIVIQATDLTSSDAPLDVQFISGSQKFRTSVALAAGIGQYAGRGVGSVRSLIIDEGFGSLDSQGRQEMIDELHNLSNLMDRVIVVSHQEDFQDRTLFPTGYLLRKDGQRTAVERFV